MVNIWYQFTQVYLEKQCRKMLLLFLLCYILSLIGAFILYICCIATAGSMQSLLFLFKNSISFRIRTLLTWAVYKFVLPTNAVQWEIVWFSAYYLQHKGKCFYAVPLNVGILGRKTLHQQRKTSLLSDSYLGSEVNRQRRQAEERKLVYDTVSCVHRYKDAINPFSPAFFWLYSKMSLPNRSAPYWSNTPFLIFDIRALWRSGLSARAPECQKLKMVG